MTAERSRKSQSCTGWTPGFTVLPAQGLPVSFLLRTFPKRENPDFCQPKSLPGIPFRGGASAPSVRPAPPALGTDRPSPAENGGPARDRQGASPPAPLTDLGEGSQQDPEGDLERDLHVGVVQGEDVQPRLLESGAAGARRGAGAHRRGAEQLRFRGCPRLRRAGRQRRQQRQQRGHGRPGRGGARGPAAAHGCPCAALEPRAGRRHHPAPRAPAAAAAPPPPARWASPGRRRRPPAALRSPRAAPGAAPAGPSPAVAPPLPPPPPPGSAGQRRGRTLLLCPRFQPPPAHPGTSSCSPAPAGMNGEVQV